MFSNEASSLRFDWNSGPPYAKCKAKLFSNEASSLRFDLNSGPPYAKRKAKLLEVVFTRRPIAGRDCALTLDMQ